MSAGRGGGGGTGPPTESDWAKFGLEKGPPSSRYQEGAGGGEFQPATGPGELFREEQGKVGGEVKPWWAAHFFLKEPVLFGTWDGVFTSVLVNIFGVIVFLKTGWIVGNAGINQAVLILCLCCALALVPILSAIGICERCQIQSGGVYFLVSHILGGQIGGAIGVVYSFGQAVGTSLVAVGFGESMAHLMGSDSGVLVCFIAIAIVIALVGINVAGVKWVIKLQIVLLLILILAIGDLTLGSFVRYNPDRGVIGYSEENWRNNTGPAYEANQNFFSVFGVFFSTFTGVLAGVNMSGDLREPSKNIPIGQLAALGACFSFCLLFMLILGAVGMRDHLLHDVMIAEAISLTKVLFLAGLYVSSLSSIIGSLYGSPRVLQCIAAENVIPFMKPLEAGRGPNKVPVWATLALTLVSIIFILIRDMNTLALIAVMPFLLTYAFVNYAYVSLAMTFDLQQQKDLANGINRKVYQDGVGIPASYGSMDQMKAAAMAEGGGGAGDLDHLFPERTAKKGERLPPSPRKGDPEKNALVPGDQDHEPTGPDDGPALLDKGGIQGASIIHQPRSWYSFLCNRWLALIGAIVNMVILFLAHLGFAFANVLLLFLLYFYIGHANPGVFPGISEFSIPHCIRTVLSRFGKGGAEGDEVIVAPLHPGVDTFTSKFTEDNHDYSSRDPYHQAKTEQLDRDDFD